MLLKIFKAIWFLSILVTLANLLYVYASLPETVIINDRGASLVSVSREGFFYMITAVIAFVNVLVYVVSYVFRKEVDFRTWFHGLVVTLNIFFIISLHFVSLFNSGEKFDYGRIDFIIYGSIALFVLWALGWPFYSVYKNFIYKQLV